MAEGYVVRRSGSGSGGSELNIFTGTTPPASNVGVFAQTTAQVDHKYIVPSGFLQGEDVPVFEICQNPWPTTSTGLMSSYPGHDGTDITYFIVFNGIASGIVYSHNISSDLYTNIGSFLPSGTNYYNTWNTSSGYNNGVLYVYGWGSGTRYALQASMYSIESGTTSVVGSVVVAGTNYTDLNGSTLCTVYDNRIYVNAYATVFTSSNRSTIRCFTFISSIESTGIVSFITDSTNYEQYGNASYQAYKRCPATSSDNFLYCWYNDGYYEIDMSNNSYRSVGTKYGQGANPNVINGYYIILGYAMFKYKDYLYQFMQSGFGASTTVPIMQDINNPSQYWQYNNQFSVSSATSTVSTTVDTGRYIMIYNASGFTLKFDYLSGSSLEPNSLAIVVNTSAENLADIITGDSDNVRIPVEAVYYYDGTNLTTLDAQVRVTGGEWTLIQS